MKRRRVIRLKNKSCSSLSTRRRAHIKKITANIAARCNAYRSKQAREAEEDKLVDLH
ncbi:MAG: hypothetical protein MJK04_34305 [Psychrosphaera sp.]|nr:hypothetical protein [Psychrosphaera sp.]